MTALPDTPPQRYERTPVLVTLATSDESSGDLARTLSLPVYAYKIGWADSLLDADWRAWSDAIEDLAGGAGSRNFYEHEDLVETALEIGPGDGATTVFTVPGKEIVTSSIKVGGVETGATLLAGSGPDGEDRLSFASPPGSGISVVVTFTGRRRRLGKITRVGQMVPSESFPRMWSFDLDLLEVPA